MFRFCFHYNEQDALGEIPGEKPELKPIIKNKPQEKEIPAYVYGPD